MPANMQPQTTADLLATYSREFLLLSGKDGVGKSSALVSLAAYVEMLWPDAKFNVIDTEHKFGSALKSFGDNAPRNLLYWPVADMNEATAALRAILSNHKPGDWVAVESMARLWERAQNLAYEAVAGVSRVEYLEAKLNSTIVGKDGQQTIRKNSPIPRPDDFWAIAKGAHDAAFLDLLTSTRDINVAITTTIKPYKADSNRFESKDRAVLRAELGIDLNMDGAPRLSYYVETMILLELAAGKVSARVLRDNNSKRQETRPTFHVPDRQGFAMAFYGECR